MHITVNVNYQGARLDRCVQFTKDSIGYYVPCISNQCTHKRQPKKGLFRDISSCLAFNVWKVDLHTASTSSNITIVFLFPTCAEMNNMDPKTILSTKSQLTFSERLSQTLRMQVAILVPFCHVRPARID